MRENPEIVSFLCFGTACMGQKQPRGKVSPWSTGVLQACSQPRIQLLDPDQICRNALKGLQPELFKQKLGDESRLVLCGLFY